MTDEKKTKQMRTYTELQAINRIENILKRVQPVSARARVMGYVADRLGDEAIQAEVMADQRQESLPLGTEEAE